MTHSVSPDRATAGAYRGSALDQSTIVSLFEAQVISRPFSTALEVNSRTLTYSQLASRAHRLANYLRANDIGRGHVVAICLKRTENLVVGMLGVLIAGAAYLPLNPSDPALRLGQVMSHAATRLLVTDSQSMTNLPEGSVQVCVLDRQQAATTGGPLENVPCVSESTDLAYVVYTSGTTGIPKGVAVTHGALANVVTDIAQRIAFTESASWLAVTTVSFDIAALELLLPLCYGGTVILASEDQARIGHVLAGIIVHKRPTVMQATPITWRILLESGWAGCPDLTILCGGERLDRDLANKLIVRSASLWNMYGPTETTIWSTADRVPAGEDTVTIGRPLANTNVYILDREGQHQPTGTVGEICIGGAGLAHGYVNDPGSTRQYFVDLSVGALRGIRVYRTGDLGRWNEHGKLEFYGRIDHQVKINGYRIELGEIESAIRGVRGVVDAAVLGIEVAANQKRLYAFVVAEPDIEITAAALVAHLVRYLPRYMIPERFFSLERLPSTPNGKRDIASMEALAKTNPGLPC
jgi:amino acid adenylation domain-containing protein